MTPAGVVTVLHDFTGAEDDTRPVGNLVQAADGSFYGTTSGLGFEVHNPAQARRRSDDERHRVQNHAGRNVHDLARVHRNGRPHTWRAP
jgi:hypothetical protein